MVEKLNIEKKRGFGQEIDPTIEDKRYPEKEVAEAEKLVENEKTIQQTTSVSDDIADAQKTISSTTKSAVPKTATRQKVDSILQDDLSEIYQGLDAKTKTEFKQKGVETASKIEGLIETMKAKAKAVLGLIRDWLTIIPGVNKHFLEQESKIKTDKIVAIAKERKKEIKNKII